VNIFKKYLVSSVCLMIALVAPLSHSQTNKPLKVIVPFAVGGASDTYTRLVMQKVAEQSGRTIVVENKTGAGGRIAFDYVAHQTPDGSMAVLIDATYAMLPGLFNNLTWDVSTDLVPSAFITQTPFVILVRSESSYMTLKDLVSAAKANPNQLNYGSAGVGSTNHIVTERFNASAGITLTHVPFKGMSEANFALQSGNIDLIIAALPTALSGIQSGKLRPLAVSSAKRSALFPKIPTAEEQGVNSFVTSNWFGFAFPKGTPKDQIQLLSDSVNKALADNEVKEKLSAQGAEIINLSVDEFGKFMQEDTKRWTDITRSKQIKIN
jgi:tripartite-type tricarboxylate transporter receptor subunit TctC